MATYLSIAERDLGAAKRELQFEPNISGRLTEQSVEKALKAFLEIYGYTDSDIKLMHSHKPYRIYTRCVTLGLPQLNKDDVSILKELDVFYYDTNYPGNEYIELMESEVGEAIVVADRVLNIVKSILELGVTVKEIETLYKLLPNTERTDGEEKSKAVFRNLGKLRSLYKPADMTIFSSMLSDKPK